MNQSKREFNFGHSTNVVIKKLRTTFDKQILPPTCFECLPNEIFYEIFDYLDPYDTDQIFLNLNIRFKNLLTQSLLPLKINLSNKLNLSIEERSRHIIIPNKHRLLSLHFNDPLCINTFFIHCNIDSSFTRLESIILNNVLEEKILVILFYLNTLSRLFSLTMQCEKTSLLNIADIYRLIFQLPVLKFNKLTLKSAPDDLSALIPVSINVKFSTIEYLNINMRCNVDEITSILYHTPHLRHLSCKQLYQANKIIGKEVILTLPHLIYASFLYCLVTFDVLEVFIKKISAELQVLRLVTSHDEAYLDVNRWERLIKEYIPHLCKFRFDYSVYHNGTSDVIPDREAITQFTSTFWIERQWFFKFTDKLNCFLYSIRPISKQWFNSYEQIMGCVNQKTDECTLKSNNISSSFEINQACGPSIQMIIAGYSPSTWNTFHLDRMKLCFQVIPFTHLTIHSNKIPLDLVLKIIHLLPNIIYLEIDSLSTVSFSCLGNKDIITMFHSVKTNSRIRKVKFNNQVETIQIRTLMYLCPRMEYFEMIYTTKNDLENILGFISMKNSTFIPHLCCLSLCVRNVINENIIENLHAIIDFERLFHSQQAFRDYTIQWIQDKIFLQWKL
ncbi:unnamed protein product [Adineta steineri]|uniref:F-box domain-containing protein n=1 Tax=Adineta steineri TaxID=433720 RepID=A0A815DH99_9BILA|nr:unnamed protein product [Adineta steineri]CAF1570981.1 unnamed protein product [Adineta steineri]